MLTRKQHELLNFIYARIRETGVSPSFDEMKDALDLRSKSGIHRLITALEERGFVRRLPHRARALEILRMPDSAVPERSAGSRGSAGPGAAIPAMAGHPDLPMPPAARSHGFTPSVIEGRFGRPAPPETRQGEAHEAGEPPCELAVMGRIAAGTPIEALQEVLRHVGVPGSMLRGGEHYALEVRGDSMINAGILDGDTVIIRRCDTAANGDIVVALVDDHEATLKRLRRKGNTLALEAANPAYETRIFGPDRVKVQGRLVGLMRDY